MQRMLFITLILTSLSLAACVFPVREEQRNERYDHDRDNRREGNDRDHDQRRDNDRDRDQHHDGRY